MDVDALPPLGEEGDLRPDELPAWVLGQLHQHVVEDVLRLVAVVFVKRLDPALIADGETAGVNEQPRASKLISQQQLSPSPLRLHHPASGLGTKGRRDGSTEG